MTLQLGNVTYSGINNYFADIREGQILSYDSTGYIRIITAGAKYISYGWMCKDLTLQKHNVSSVFEQTQTGDILDIVESANKNAYPENGAADGYWYTMRD